MQFKNRTTALTLPNFLVLLCLSLLITALLYPWSARQYRILTAAAAKAPEAGFTQTIRVFEHLPYPGEPGEIHLFLHSQLEDLVSKPLPVYEYLAENLETGEFLKIRSNDSWTPGHVMALWRTKDNTAHYEILDFGKSAMVFMEHKRRFLPRN
jgi:hypothetical protein